MDSKKSKKSLVIAVIVFIVAFLIVLMPTRSSMINKNIKDANEILEKILLYIENKDKEGLKSMFSEKALAEAVDFDQSMERLFNFVDGTIISWGDRAGMVAKDINSGKKRIEMMYSYDLKTEQYIYKICFIACTISAENPEEEGLYMVQLFDKENASEWGKTRNAGIFVIAD